MSILKNDRFLRAIKHQPVDATPIWIMRQAGRYLPEYREVRKQAGSFLKLCKNPELACTVTLQPIQRFDLDAAILFSDILTIPDAMGLGLQFKEGEGPFFERPLQSEQEIQKLGIPDPEISLSYVLETIKMIRRELDNRIPLIGFCGSPWTLAAYMVQGQGKSTFPKLQALMKENPRALHQLLDKLAQAVAHHLNAQIKAGAQTVMIFDTWGGLLDTNNYAVFSLYYVQQIFSQLDQSVPSILFTKQGGKWLNIMSQSGCHVLGLDHTVNLQQARAELNNKVALQGNMNPEILCQSPEIIRAEVAKILADFGKGSGHIFNLGHGITPEVPPENVSVLIEAVHTLSKEYHL